MWKVVGREKQCYGMSDFRDEYVIASPSFPCRVTVEEPYGCTSDEYEKAVNCLIKLLNQGKQEDLDLDYEDLRIRELRGKLKVNDDNVTKLANVCFDQTRQIYELENKLKELER
ncbi:hypothetical protein LCGC14_1776150 [marine sediment metagenome]|uniref:Uncharacterized protein n=1 Tax=marine sediment metagenome TaxID=412755 RepID=A0A0F9JWK1_9ZZZZ|nr:hypothetical protein [Candidatus Scalindua sp.]